MVFFVSQMPDADVVWRFGPKVSDSRFHEHQAPRETHGDDDNMGGGGGFPYFRNSPAPPIINVTIRSLVIFVQFRLILSYLLKSDTFSSPFIFIQNVIY